MYQSEIDRAKPQKLYFQLLDILRGHIESESWKVGAQIPTEGQLCGQYNVSKATVRLAIAELVSLGYLKKLQGKGTFIRRRKPVDRIPMLLNLGEDNCPSCLIRILDSRVHRPDEPVRSQLSLSEGNYCFCLTRLIIADGTPRMVQKIHLSSAAVQAPDHAHLEGEAQNQLSLHAFLEAGCGTRIHRVREMVDVGRAGREETVHLDIADGMPVLRVRHLCYARGDEPISYSETMYRTDGYARTQEFERLKL